MGGSRFDLSGRVAVVTGGNGGIGLAIARGLAEAGAALAIVGRDECKNDAAARQLDSHAERLRGEVKTQAVPMLTGKVARLFPDHGFVVTEEGLEVYFHANSVSGNRFGRLAEGDEVRLAVAEGESPNGPQATTVLPRRRRNAAIAAD